MKTLETINDIAGEYIHKGSKILSELFTALNVNPTDSQENEVLGILALMDRDWQNADCDPEGATKEQQSRLDSIIQNATKQIIKLLKK